MNISEKHRPKLFNDFVGNQDAVKEVVDIIKQNKSVVIVGPPGCGKTTIAYVIANEFGFVPIKTNASDERRKDELTRIERDLKMKSFIPVLYIFDEVDGIHDWSIMLRILKKCKVPVILTANEKRKLPKEIFKFAKLVEFKALKTTEVATRMNKIAKLEGVEIKLDKISGDMRESIQRTFYNSDSYEKEKSDFDKVDEIFKHKGLHEISPMWLIDNISSYFDAKDFYEVIEIIKIYSKTKDINILKALPKAKNGKSVYPNYFRQMVRNNGSGST